jgi:hypothetical protein
MRSDIDLVGDGIVSDEIGKLGSIKLLVSNACSVSILSMPLKGAASICCDTLLMY